MTTIPQEVPAGTDHHERVERIINTVRQDLTGIEGFAYPAPGHKRKVSASAGRITDAQLHAVATAIDSHPALIGAAEMTTAQFRAEIIFCAAYEALRAELERDAAAIDYVVKRKRAALANIARRIVQMAESLNNKPEERERALAIPHVAALRDLFKRKKARPVPETTAPSVATAPPPAPAPAPAPSTPSTIVKTS